MIIGVHVSISGGVSLSVDRAKRLGCRAFQIFSSNPRGWKRRAFRQGEVEAFIEGVKENHLSPVIIHTPYLINLSASDDDIYRKSIDALKADIERAGELRADYLVTHIGSAKGMERADGIRRVQGALEECLSMGIRPDLKILLENSSGSGSSLGGSFDEIGEIIEPFNPTGAIGICMDTCHAFSAGYPLFNQGDIDLLLGEIDRCIGLGYLHLIHLNDSKGDLGSRLDLHEDIGEGKIGIDGFRAILNHGFIRDIPLILETPKDCDEDDIRNLKRVYEIAGMDYDRVLSYSYTC